MCNNMENLKNILLNERNQTQKSTLYHCLCGTLEKPSLLYGDTMSISSCLGPGVEAGQTGQGQEGAAWSNGTVLYFDSAGRYSGVDTCQALSNCTLRMHVHFIICKLYVKRVCSKQFKKEVLGSISTRWGRVFLRHSDLFSDLVKITFNF